jgi:hypothetical protein
MTIQYKLQNDPITQQSCAVGIVGQNISIPFDPANSDMQQFKKEVLAGAELQDADGNVMTQEQTNEFIATLP